MTKKIKQRLLESAVTGSIFIPMGLTLAQWPRDGFGTTCLVATGYFFAMGIFLYWLAIAIGGGVKIGIERFKR